MNTGINTTAIHQNSAAKVNSFFHEQQFGITKFNLILFTYYCILYWLRPEHIQSCHKNFMEIDRQQIIT